MIKELFYYYFGLSNGFGKKCNQQNQPLTKVTKKYLTLYKEALFVTLVNASQKLFSTAGQETASFHKVWKNLFFIKPFNCCILLLTNL